METNPRYICLKWKVEYVLLERGSSDCFYHCYQLPTIVTILTMPPFHPNSTPTFSLVSHLPPSHSCVETLTSANLKMWLYLEIGPWKGIKLKWRFSVGANPIYTHVFISRGDLDTQRDACDTRSQETCMRTRQEGRHLQVKAKGFRRI